MNPTTTTRAQRRQAIQERMMKNRNLLGKAESHSDQTQSHIL